MRSEKNTASKQETKINLRTYPEVYNIFATYPMVLKSTHEEDNTVNTTLKHDHK
jgi:hypothetical protein